MADVDKYVNTDYSGGGNDGSESNPYVSLSSWDANEDGAVNSPDTHTCHFKSGTADDTSSVDLSGWSGTGTLRIQQWSGGSAFVLKPTGTSHAITTPNSSTLTLEIDGITIDMADNTGSSAECMRLLCDTDATNCVFRNGDYDNQDGLYTGANSRNHTVKDCFFYTFDRGAIHIQGSSSVNIDVINCVGYDIKCYNSSSYCVFGFDSSFSSTSSVMRVINCAAHEDGTSGDCYHEGSGGNGTYASNSDYNISSDTTAETEFGATNSHNSVTFQAGTGGSGDRAMFIDLTGPVMDLHAEDNANNFLKDKGAGPSHSTLGSYVRTTDFDGDSRSGTTCWIGADEVTAAGDTVAPNDSTHALSSDGATVAQDHKIVAADSAHALSSDGATIAQDHKIVVADSAHALTSDNTTVVSTPASGDIVAPADSTHALTSDGATIAQDHAIAADDSVHALTSDEATIAQDHAIAVDDSTHALTSDNTTVRESTADVISPADCAHLLQSSSPIIVEVPYHPRSKPVKSRLIGWDAFNAMAGGAPQSGEDPIEWIMSDGSEWRMKRDE